MEKYHKRSFLWKPFSRQLLVCSGLWMMYFIAGMIAGAPTVLLPQIRKEANSTDAVTEDMASWILSVIGIAGMPWLLILPLLMHFIGRKWSFAFVSSITIAGYTVFYCSSTIKQILISEIVLGITVTSNLTLSPTILTEFSSPQYRGIFLTLKSAMFFWGVWVSNAIGVYFHWKIIGLVSLICGIYLATVLFWYESPYWLVINGHYDECAKAHRWLKGTSQDMERELELLISYQKEYNKIRRKNVDWFTFDRIKSILRTACSRQYYKPLIICILLYALYHSSGKMVCSAYAIDIVKKITRDENTAYNTMLVLDGVTVVGMYAGCIVSRYVKRRTLLFITAPLSIAFLFILSLYLYLIKLTIIYENNYVSISLLMIFTFSLCSGPILLCGTLYGEIMPLRFKSSMLVISGAAICSIYTMYLKVAPLMFRSLGLHGSFLYYGIASLIITFILYKYLPETKDKTLQEIEDEFIGNKYTFTSFKFSEGHDLINKET